MYTQKVKLEVKAEKHYSYNLSSEGYTKKLVEIHLCC